MGTVVMVQQQRSSLYSSTRPSTLTSTSGINEYLSTR